MAVCRPSVLTQIFYGDILSGSVHVLPVDIRHPLAIPHHVAPHKDLLLLRGPPHHKHGVRERPCTHIGRLTRGHGLCVRRRFIDEAHRGGWLSRGIYISFLVVIFMEC